LLRGAGSVDGMSAVMRFLGFTGRILPLDSRTRTTLQLPSEICTAHIAEGDGALRGLALVLSHQADLRETLAATADALARQAPQLLWLVIAIHSASRAQAVVCWSASSPRPRILSLLCDRDRVYESDAETLCALASAAGESALLTYSRWLDILGREDITRRFFRTLRDTVSELAESSDDGTVRKRRTELALLYISRLIFLSFLETKGWLDGDFGFLANGYSDCIIAGGQYQKRTLEPLFFGTLNTPLRARSLRAHRFGKIPFLNGGLFARSGLEKRNRACTFSDDAFGNAFGSLLSRYRFSAREDSSTWSDASIDPEMLGKAFEALMAGDERKSSGAFYTPQSLVEEVVGLALDTALNNANSLEDLMAVRVLDPACGSGAFLVHVLDRLSALRMTAGETGRIADVKRRVLSGSIFGVDLNPMAVWLCELRLWLAIVIESTEADPMRVTPLPNLDRHIRVGDSLLGGGFIDAARSPRGKKLAVLRSRYMRAAGPRKRTLARAMDRAERAAAIETLNRERTRLSAARRELLTSLRARDLFGERHMPDRTAVSFLRDLRSQIRNVKKRARALAEGAALPFSFAANFPDVGSSGGFDLVVGNPPWVRLHEIAPASRARLRAEFVVYRSAAWMTGANAGGAGRGFAAQVDMSALFVERSIGLLRPEGTMALLLPSKLWRSLAGGGVRQLVRERADLVHLADMSESSAQFDAAVYPSVLVSKRKPMLASKQKSVSLMVRLDKRDIEWTGLANSLSFDETPGSPWLILPPRARKAFELVRNAGTPFHRVFGAPLLGVKTGCNGAFIVGLEHVNGNLATIATNDRRGCIEREMLRPLIRGESLSAWRAAGQREYLVWPQDRNNFPRKELPPFTRAWLVPFRDQLSARTDLRGRLPWWTVFRTESARCELPRVVWADFGLTPRAMVLPALDSTVPLNSCYATSCATSEDAHALAAILNGPLAAHWLNAIAEPARGGYRRYLGWTMSLLPLPIHWDRARAVLAPLGERAMAGEAPTDAELLESSADAYGLKLADIEPLLSWREDCD
jgi:Eco57I restriction-modification methylase